MGDRETLNLSGNSFGEELKDFEAWLAERAPRARWQTVRVIELGLSASQQADHAVLSDASDPDARFEEILRFSEGGWVNLTALTIKDQTLVVGLEWRPAREPRNRPVSVNRGGFDRGELHRLGLSPE